MLTLADDLREELQESLAQLDHWEAELFCENWPMSGAQLLNRTRLVKEIHEVRQDLLRVLDLRATYHTVFAYPPSVDVWRLCQRARVWLKPMREALAQPEGAM